MIPPSTKSSVDILQRLKSSTADIHERVEQQLQIFAPEFDIPAYIQLLSDFYGFWAPVEAQLCRISGLQDSELKLQTRMKSHLLEADLRIFGLDPRQAEMCSALPDVQTFHSGLGCMYVLEGSTLGSQFIAKHIAAKFNIAAGSGASFFNAYGRSVGEQWSAFRDFLCANASHGDEDEVLMAARGTFETLSRWLAKSHVAVSAGSRPHE
jgi:heme oxygenase